MKTAIRIFILLLVIPLLFSCSHSEHGEDGGKMDPDKLLSAEEIANHNCEKHGHVYSEATCQAPSVCYYCGDTDGKKGDHDRTKATCLEKSRCTFCKEEFGEYGEHKFEKASCAGASSCAVCGISSGTATEHKWKGATCVTPSMCSVCMKKSGEALGHIWTGGSCTEGKTCTRCSRKSTPTGHKMSEGSCTKDSVCSVCGYTVKAEGHVFESGKCTVCGKNRQQAVEESRIEEQNRTTEKVTETTESLDTSPLTENARSVKALCEEAHTLCQSAIDDIYGTGNETALSAVEKLSEAVTLLSRMKSYCDTDKRLASCKTYIDAVIKPIQKHSQIKSFNQSSILKNVVDMRAACTEAKNMCDKMINYIDSLS